MRLRDLREGVERSTDEPTAADTLVIYVYSNTDLEYERNLRYFVQHGMWEGDGCEYLIIVQQVKCVTILLHMPHCSAATRAGRPLV